MPGHFERRYTDEQRAALYRLKRDHELTGRELARAAAAGIGDLEPFDVPRDTANRIAKEEAAHARELAASPVATLAESDARGAVRALVARLAALADAELARLEARPAGHRPRAHQLEPVARLLERMEAATRRLDPTPRAGSSAPDVEPEQAPEPTGLLAELAGADDETPPRETPLKNEARVHETDERTPEPATTRAAPASDRATDDGCDDAPAFSDATTSPALVPELAAFAPPDPGRARRHDHARPGPRSANDPT